MHFHCEWNLSTPFLNLIETEDTNTCPVLPVICLDILAQHILALYSIIRIIISVLHYS